MIGRLDRTPGFDVAPALALGLGLVLSTGPVEAAAQSDAAVSPPAIHHVHLNSTDPDAAISWYLRVWPEARRGRVAGHAAFLADLPLLFDRVDEPPPGAFDPALGRSVPQSPLWHIGAFVNTTRALRRLDDDGIRVLRLHVGPDDRVGVRRSGLTPYAGVRTATQLARAERAEPRDGGFGYVLGPDGALVEMTGTSRTRPSFSHVHLFHEAPGCAANWYVEHLGLEFTPRRDPATGQVVPGRPYEDCATERPGDPGWPSLERAGTIRTPTAAVRHGAGTLSIYPRQCHGDRCGSDQPLVSSRGQVFDHLAFTVTDLDAVVTRLRGAGVRILEAPHAFGGGRAAMIEGPDGLAIELIESPPPPEVD